ncbi:hypothetical protein CU048_00405 [Beijerinckiaceae bacterium]|nr:hypothetical protein CU048_00405 [Beijerinckiaceae bacterium]
MAVPSLCESAPLAAGFVKVSVKIRDATTLAEFPPMWGLSKGIGKETALACTTIIRRILNRQS